MKNLLDICGKEESKPLKKKPKKKKIDIEDISQHTPKKNAFMILRYLFMIFDNDYHNNVAKPEDCLFSKLMENQSRGNSVQNIFISAVFKSLESTKEEITDTMILLNSFLELVRNSLFFPQ